MRYLVIILTFLVAQSVYASEGLIASKSTSPMMVYLSDQQLDKLKDTAEHWYPNDPHQQWYFIMVELESYYTK